MFNEIGSEFYELEVTDNSWLIDKKENITYTLSGRTSIDYIIKMELNNNKNIKAAYLPSYCCESIIKPFLTNGVEVFFYNVYFNKVVKYDIDEKVVKKCDIIFIMSSYFGFNIPKIKCLEGLNNKIIIEDVTHNIFTKKNYEYDYAFSSVRKWTGVKGGSIIYSEKKIKCLDNVNYEYENIRKEAFNLKSRYLKNNKMSKDKFLYKFKQSDNLLLTQSNNYGVSEQVVNDIEHIDIQYIIQKRKKNARILINQLNNLCLFKDLKEDECPLFVPLKVEIDIRDRLNKFLINNQIYCPIHWPISKLHNLNVKSKEIYLSEISLICDQRYNENDMNRIVECINRYLYK